MVLSATQTTAFMEDGSQMGIPHGKVDQIQNEGIGIIDDLTDFDKSMIKHISANLHCPVGSIDDTNPGATLGATIHVYPFVFVAKPQKRQVVSAKLLCYYEIVYCPTSAANVQCKPAMKKFELKQKSLEENKKRDESKVINITKTFLIIKRAETFTDYNHPNIGARTISLAYEIQLDEVVSAIGEIQAGTPHSVKHGLVEDELIT